MANLSKRTKYFSTIEDKKYSILEAVDLLKSSPKRLDALEQSFSILSAIFAI